MPDRSADVLARLVDAGLCTVDPGLSDTEFARIERVLAVQFADDHRALLRAGVPRGSGWPNLRDHEAELKIRMGRPIRTLVHAIRSGFWLPSWGQRTASSADPVREASRIAGPAPRMLPLFATAYVPQRPDPTTVWVLDGSSVTTRGESIPEFLTWLADRSSTRVSAPMQRVPFWSDFIEPPEVETFDPLPAPPFAADRQQPSAASGTLGAEYLFAEIGFGAEPHGGVLSDGTLLWTARIPHGSDTAVLWRSLRNRYPGTGLWPILFTDLTFGRIGYDGGIPDHQNLADVSPRGLLHSALDGAAWLTARFGELENDFERTNERFDDGDDAETADWADMWRRDADAFSTIALIATPAPWFVPGLLRWSGAANYDVGGVDHATLLRRWQARWGAELVALADEEQYLRVASPPTAEDALGVALEHALYCPDAVAQDAGSLDCLAEWRRYPLWRFWWD